MSKVRRWLRLGVELLLLAALAVLLAWYWLMPRLAGDAVESALARLGLKSPTVRVDSVGANHLRVSRIMAGDGREIMLSNLQADFSLSGLRHGRLQSLVLNGLRWKISYANGKLDLGPILPPARATPAASNASPLDLPFDSLVLSNSTIDFDLNGQIVSLPIAVELQKLGVDAWKVHFSSPVIGLGVRLDGELRYETPPSLELTRDTMPRLHFTGELAVGTQRFPVDFIYNTTTGDTHLLIVSSASQQPNPLVIDFTRIDGKSSLTLDTHLNQLARSFTLAGRSIGFDRVKADVKANFDNDWRLADLDASVQFDNLGIGGRNIALLTAQLTGLPQGSSLKIHSEPSPGQSIDLTASSALPLIELLTRRKGKIDLKTSATCPSDAEGVRDWLDQWGVKLRSSVALTADIRSSVTWDADAQPSVAFKLSDAHLALAPCDIEAAGARIEKLAIDAHVTGGGDWTGVEFSARVTTPGNVPIRRDPWSVDLAQPVLDANLRWSPGQGMVVNSLFKSHGSSVSNAGLEVLATGMDVELPVRFASQKPEKTPATQPVSTGAIRIKNASIKGISVSDLSGALGFDTDRLSATLKSAAEARPQVDAVVNLTLKTGNLLDGEVRASVVNLDFSEPAIIHRIAPATRDVDLTGTVSAYFVTNFTDGVFKPWLTVDISNGRVSSKTYQLEMNGIAAQVNFDKLWPLHSPPFQWVTVKSASAGKLLLRDGLVQFTMQTPTSILVERTRWTLGKKGRFWVHAFWMDPTASEINMEVFLEDIDIADLLVWAAGDKARGQGLIYGRIPLVIRPGGDRWIIPGDGFLYAQPGIGWYEIPQTQPADTPAADISASIKGQIVGSLTDFEYQMLSLQFLTDDKGPVVRVFMKGSARHGEVKTQFDGITINLRGLEGLLDMIIHRKR